MTRRFRWFDRAFKPVGVKVEVVVCNGKCRKNAPDLSCPLHGKGGRA